jgi:hypothetical protein
VIARVSEDEEDEDEDEEEDNGPISVKLELPYVMPAMYAQMCTPS